MTIIQLNYIIALEETRNFTKAANLCGISQPTLSMQIKKLEEELKIIIFDRSKKPIELTKIGSSIIKQAKKILLEVNKIDDLIKVCKSLSEISNDNEIHIFTNKHSEFLVNKCKENLSVNINFEIIDQPINDRLLPWYHVNLMRKFFNRTEITHFISKKNVYYWINSRKILKKFNLIPGFTRTETNPFNKEIYAIDFVKKNELKDLPNLYLNKTYDFINHHYPYQGMYLYDRELMKEYLFGPSSNPDCGHGAYKINYLDTRMINLDLMAKANIGLTYIDVPEGFYNRIVTLYNKDQQRIDKVCCVEHLSQKYSNEGSSFGNIKLEEALS